MVRKGTPNAIAARADRLAPQAALTIDTFAGSKLNHAGAASVLRPQAP